MPYWFETQKIKLPKDKDRRRKLTNEDKQTIKDLFFQMGYYIREIARVFEDRCSRRTIQFILYPERLKRLNANRNWRDCYNKDKHNEYMKSYRKYKSQVLKKENIKRSEKFSKANKLYVNM